MKFPSKSNKYQWQDILIKNAAGHVDVVLWFYVVLMGVLQIKKSSGILWEKMQNSEIQTKITTTVTVTPAVESASVILLI